MPNLHLWLMGARLRTLPAALAPVMVGTALAYSEQKFQILPSLLAFSVASFLQIGCNFANDYSDGIRGTDQFRTGPTRLTGGNLLSPQTVLKLALSNFLLASLAGLWLIFLTESWILLLLGVGAIAAAWFYTGGSKPYGYMALGEVFVLLFFGYAATLGTLYTQAGSISFLSLVLATNIGILASALLMINNIRDIPTDIPAQKITLAVKLGQVKARRLFLAMLVLPVVTGTAVGVFGYPVFFALLVLLPLGWHISAPVRQGATGISLIKVLKATSLFELLYAILISAGIIYTHYFPASALITLAA